MDPTPKFALKPYEDMIPGVRFRDEVLRLRPTWAATSLDLYGLGFGALLLGIGIATLNVFTLVAGVVLVAIFVPYLRCRVVAQGNTILVVNKWNRRRFDVGTIRSVGLSDYAPGSFVPFRGPLTIWPQELLAGVLITRDNDEVRCDALVGLPRSLTGTDQNPVKAKTEILKRWVESAVNAPSA
jgi:hypothetical protein